MIKIRDITDAKSGSAFRKPYIWLGILAAAALLCVQTTCSKVVQADTTAASPVTSPATSVAATSASAVPAVVASSNIIGRMIAFNAGGGSEQFRKSGWSKTEKEFTWSEGKTAKLGLPIPSNPGALTLNMKLGALVNPPAVASQMVEVIANGQKIADWQVADTADFSARIPAEVTKNGGILNVELRVPNATSPKALGLNDDSRILGVRVYSVELKRP